MAVIPGTTAAAIAAGSFRHKWVVSISGYDKLLTDADPARALEAWAGTDWTQALEGLVVDCRPEQVADPHDPFANQGGTCVLHVLDPADAFGVEVNRRGAGAWTTLAETIDRNDTALTIRAGANFAAGPSEAHIGIECIGYSGKTATTMTVTERGKYNAVGAVTGSGGSRFADHHRVALDQRQVQMNPVISQQPRRWIGRRVYVYAHVCDENGNLNSKADAQLVFAGRISGIADDPRTYHTVINVRHVLAELGGSIIGSNAYGATVMDGIYIPTGAVFKLAQYRNSVAKIATQLDVITSGATGTNQIDAGFYSLDEICSFLNKWFGGELAAGRIDASASWQSPMITPDGVRTVCQWKVSDAGSVPVILHMSMPAGVAGLLGFGSSEGVSIGGTSLVTFEGTSNTSHTSVSNHVPYRVAVFSKGGPGGSLPTFRITCENEHGEFVDQYELMPSILKPGMDSTKQWGLFLVDEKLLIQASFTAGNNGVLENCFITPFGQHSAGESGSQEPFYTLGRRADDDSGPVTVRQVFDLEGSFEQLMNVLHYNTGTPGYNHPTHDTRARGLGAAIPGGLLGGPFEASIKALPKAQAMMRLRFDEPTQLAELIGGELLVRGAFPVWKNEGIVYQSWHTPVAARAIGTLTDANKASPEGHRDDHRTPTLEDAQHARPVAKIDFNPDFSFGRETRYRASMQLEDQVGVDDAGNLVPEPMTIKLRGTPDKEAALELSANYLGRMPMTSRPSRFLTRSITPAFAEGYAPGDVLVVEDKFARDPLTGQRGIDGRAATIMRHSFSWGHSVPGEPQAEPEPMGGTVDLNFFDVNRDGAYGPAADIDESASSGGFSAGYNSGTLTIRCKDHVYSEASEAVDAAGFGDAYSVIIVEKDPADPAAPVFWERTLATPARSGSDLTLTSGLSAPAWDPAKKYRIIFNRFSLATTLQRDCAFQADDADEMIEDVEVPYLWSLTSDDEGWSPNGTELAEFIPELSHGDGRSYDAGHERAQLVTINNLYDHKSAHHAMAMWTEYRVPTALDDWQVQYFYRTYLGLDGLSNAVFRYLTVAPWLALYTGLGATSGQVRVTISRDMPKNAIGVTTLLGDPVFDGPHAQALWTTTSTTWAVGDEQQLEVGIKDLHWGLAYVTIETYNAVCRGLAKGREGPRVLVL